MDRVIIFLNIFASQKPFTQILITTSIFIISVTLIICTWIVITRGKYLFELPFDQIRKISKELIDAEFKTIVGLIDFFTAIGVLFYLLFKTNSGNCLLIVITGGVSLISMIILYLLQCELNKAKKPIT